MLEKRELDRANVIIETLENIDKVLKDFEPSEITTTIGLVRVFSITKYKTDPSDDSRWFHEEFGEEEKMLKELCRTMLLTRKNNLRDELKKYIQA